MGRKGRHILSRREQQAVEESLEEQEEESFDPNKDNYEWIHCIVVAVVVCVLLFVLVARVIDVRGQSMEPTLYEGDKLIITRLAGDYKNGDIVVLKKDSFKDEPIVKRVIGTAGQTITIDFASGTVYVNGVALDEPYTKERTYDQYDITRPENYEAYGIDPETVTDTDRITVTVPEGCVFVMGDNRNNSSDSRNVKIGFVDTRIIMGKAVFRLYPFSRMGAVYGADLAEDIHAAAPVEQQPMTEDETTPVPSPTATSAPKEQIVNVQDSGMEPTLEEGDELSVIAQAEGYACGDIVALQKDSFQQAPIVRRVIATGGQTVTIDFASGTVSVDGAALAEPYVLEPATEAYDILDPAYAEIFGTDPETDITETAVTVTVPAGCLFVLGDNRNDSSDSREGTIAFVDTQDVIGKALSRVAPEDRAGDIYGVNVNMNVNADEGVSESDG